MLPVSNEFLAAIAAPSRKTTAEIVFGILDNDAWLDNTKQVSSQASISRLDQLTNRVRRTGRAYASLEQDRWALDGTFVLPPKQGQEIDAEVGWWGSNLCDANGYFNPLETVTVTCGSLYNAAGLTIAFDPASGEHAKDFLVVVYGANDTLMHQEQVTDNDKTSYMLERNFPKFQKVKVEIQRWSKGYARAKIVELDFGLLKDYGEDGLIDLSMISEIDTTGATLPAGELRFKLDNQDKRFNILNPTGLYHFLQERQQITVNIGLEGHGSLQLGVFYLSEWKSDPGTLTASFVARNAIDLLGQGIYRKGGLGSVSAYDLAEAVIQDAGMDFLCSIDDALKDIQLSACVPLVSHREALLLIASACRAVAYADASGRLIVAKPPEDSTGLELSFDDMWEVPAISRQPTVNYVDIDVSTLLEKGHDEVFDGVLSVDGNVEVWLEYSSPCKNHSVTITGGTIEEAAHYAYASRVKIAGSGEVGIKVNADTMEVTKNTFTLYREEEGPGGVGLQVSNALINSEQVAFDVASSALQDAGNRLEYDIDWRQNPALECGDILAIENEFGDSKEVRIVRQEFSYAGYLSGRTKARGREGAL